MNQIERISKMEKKFDQASSAILKLSEALDNYNATIEAIDEVSDYYGSDEWKKDYADDEARLLPTELKRGVLSEDGIWNMITNDHELMVQMLETITERLRKR